MPLLGAPAGQHRVVWHAGVVDQDLDGTCLEHRRERRARGGGIGNVEVDGGGVTAAREDVPHQRLGNRHAAMRIPIHMVATTRQTAAQRTTDATAAAGHHVASGSGAHAWVPVLTAGRPKLALTTMVARPLTSGCCALHTENS